ncbi:MAG: hypothetical protein JO232_21170 [Verrucomicrobia bacterium]|jgi:hypothetical protein|nr:hypothetical protein [Verrucomicrobiota bacterium]
MSSKNVRRRNTEENHDQERASNDYNTVDQTSLDVLAAEYWTNEARLV